MASFRFIFVLLLGLIVYPAAIAQTNVYHPFPVGWGASWHTHSICCVGPVESYGSIEWGGDTIINALTYIKTYSGIGSGHTYIGAIRQNVANEEAYFLDLNNVEHNLSFDQNAVPGDTITTHLYPFSLPDSVFIVTSVDSSNVQGSYRKKFSLIPVDPASDLFEAKYLSGVGVVSASGSVFGWSLMCHSVNHNWLIGGPPNPFCVLGVDDVPLDKTFQIFPNPTNGILTLSKTPNNIRVFSMDGKEMPCERHANSLDISLNVPGIYYGYFEFDSGIVMRKIVKH